MTKKREKQLKEQRRNERETARQKKKRMQMLVVATILVVVFVVGGVFLYQWASKDAAKGMDFSYEDQPMLGEETAPVKIVEFGDYKCPACRAFHERIFPAIKERYIDTGKAQFYFKNYPILGDGSERAALAAEAVYHQDGEGFWKYHNALYANQGPETENWVTLDLLVNLVDENVPNIDANKLKEDIEMQTYENEVEEDKEKGENSGVTGTPTVFVNGVMVENNNDVLKAIEQAVNGAE
jgi:protein-disulfide isomerase